MAYLTNWENSYQLNFTRNIKKPFNPTLHGLQNVAVYTGVGHYGPPLLNASKGHFLGQML